jgi:stage V sporulation protein AE
MSLIFAFLMGGAICAAVQILIDKTNLTPARILVFLVCFGVFLYAVGLYEPAFKIFGEGVALPLLGFGAVIGRGVSEAVAERGILGAITGGLSASSAGISLALILGIVFSFFFKARPKQM